MTFYFNEYTSIDLQVTCTDARVSPQMLGLCNNQEYN